MSPDTDPHAHAADSAGVPWEGRSFQPNPHSGDDGSADPALLAALTAFHAGEGDAAAVVDAYRTARLLIPLVAEKGEEGVSPTGLTVDKTQELSIVTVAAQAGVGLDRLMKAVGEAHADWTARVKTKDLNDWLYATIARHPPPAVRGKRIKPRYLTQIKARPPTFVLISSRAEEMPESYKRYLVNGLRDAFDLHAAPVRLIVKAGKNPFTDDG